MDTPLRLLIIEDSEDDALLIVRDLERAGYEPIYERVDTDAAVRAALARGPWDIVISDFNMPRFSGTDALKLLRERDQDTPFIFVSGTIGEDVAVDAMRAGAQDYVTKGNLKRLAPAIERELRDAAVRHERRVAEESLRQSEERYRLLFESSPQPVWVYDLESLRILAVNEAAVALYGYGRDEFLGMTIERLRPQEDLPRLHEHLAMEIKPGIHSAGSCRHRKKDGTVIAVEVSGHSLVFAGHPAELVVVNDVTERRRAEEVQAAIYHLAETALVAADVPDLLRGVHEIVGTLMPARNFYIALHDEARDLIEYPYYVDEHDPAPASHRPGRTITAHVLRTGTPLLSRHDVVPSPEGTLEWVGTASNEWLGVPLKAGGRTIGVIAVQTYTAGVRYTEREQEILEFVATQVAAAIERKRAEELLRSSEERFRALVEHSGDAIALLDGEGKILFASQSTIRVLGREPADVVGNNVFTYIHPDDIPGVRAELAAAWGRVGGGAAVRARFLHQDESWRDGEGTVTNRLHDPTVRAIVFNYRDVTERHRLEAQLVQAQKMEAVGRLAGGVAHDFNNILTAIFGYTELLTETLPAESEMRGDLDEIRKAAQRAAGLTRQLLAFSRQQVLQPVVLNLNDVVESLEKMLHRLIGEDVALHAQLAAEVGNVRADPGQIEQVVMNLVVNARDAMPLGGKLTIETANAELSEQYADLHQPVIPGSYVMLAVSDTGTGMTPEVKARMFEPFFTTKVKGQGTGLGLATVYGIVKQTGGYVWVYSEPGHGATFKLYFPRVDAPVDDPVQVPELTGTRTVTETILLAEDDDLLRPLAMTLLKKLGYQVLAAANAAEALEQARVHAGPIDLLVTDVVMPGQSGRALAHQLATTRPLTRVLFISGYTDDAIVRHGMLEPGLNYMQKPFTPAALARKVRDVLDAT